MVGMNWMVSGRMMEHAHVLGINVEPCNLRAVAIPKYDSEQVPSFLRTSSFANQFFND